MVKKIHKNENIKKKKKYCHVVEYPIGGNTGKHSVNTNIEYHLLTINRINSITQNLTISNLNQFI